jgi:4-hydroxy-3-methylbut-2-enyl diphosphate reductase
MCLEEMKIMKILLANPRGFCAGVDRAIEIVERALDIFGPPIWVRHEVVHNEYVVHKLRERGAIFTDHLSEIPEGSIVIFSAHGVSQGVRTESNHRKFKVFDATCPLVTKVHMEVARYSREGWECILIGHAGHPEVEGTMGQYDNEAGGIYLVESEHDVASVQVKNQNKLTYVTQTTLSVDDTNRIVRALKEKFPNIMGPRREDICYATQNRQDAVKDLANRSNVVIVVGSVNSSNSNRLKELAERLGCESYLVDNADQIKSEWVIDKETVGVTAGASAPEILVQQVIARLKAWGGKLATELQGREENIVFALPKELRRP